MSQGGNHKYSRLSNQDDVNQHCLFSDNDKCNNSGSNNIVENIELNAKQSMDLDQSNIKSNHYDINSYSKVNESSKTINCGGNTQTQAIQNRLKTSLFMQTAIRSIATILMYLTLSIFLTFYQKALIRELKFPLSIVCYHLIVKLLLASSVRALYYWCYGKNRIQLDWYLSIRKVAPTGIASGIDIGFSNWGLELVSISLYTMTKSSTIIFILIFAILLGLEKNSWKLVFIVGLIAIGLFMFTYKSTQFDALGFIFILVASLSSGIRWSLAQFVMQKSKLGLHNPIDMIYHMQPWMIISLIPFLLTFEGKKLLQATLNSVRNPDAYEIYMNLFKLTAGAFLAFCMEVSEFLVLAKTSSLTLSIAGIFKDIFQLVLAVELNGDQLTITNVLGLIICLVGICGHILHKYFMINEMADSFTYNDSNSSSNDLLEVNFDDNCTQMYVKSGDQNALNDDGTTTAIINEFYNVNFASSKNLSSQAMPLLSISDSEDNDIINEYDDCNSSDIIFDILKRRDNPTQH